MLWEGFRRGLQCCFQAVFFFSFKIVNPYSAYQISLKYTNQDFSCCKQLKPNTNYWSVKQKRSCPENKGGDSEARILRIGKIIMENGGGEADQRNIERFCTEYNDFSPGTPSSLEVDMERADCKVLSFFPTLGFCQVDIKENSAGEFQGFSQIICKAIDLSFIEKRQQDRQGENRLAVPINLMEKYGRNNE